MPSPSHAQGSVLLPDSGFEIQLAAVTIAPGQSYYEARRSLWLSGEQKPAKPPAASVAKLQTMISSDSAIRSRKVWDTGLGNIWKGILEGGRLKYNLPLPLLIRVLYAGWMRDGTWPPGAEAPDSFSSF